MKFISIVAAFSLLVMSCQGQDVQLSRQIAGTWDMNVPVNMASFSWTDPVIQKWSMSTNGSFAQSLGHVSALIKYQGTWLVKDGDLVLTFTNAFGTGSHQPDPAIVGQVHHCKIIHVDDHQFVIRASIDTNMVITLAR